MSDRDAILQRFAAAVADAAGDPELLAEMRRRLAAATPVVDAVDAVEAESWHGLIGSCGPLRAIRGQAEKFAAARVPVLIRGESGTGKDVLARIMHEIGPRRAAPFVSENCAAIPENLLESILFGHVKGAFTGAIRDHGGHFVAAHKGTLFLDEIGDMPLPMQAKLLRALQEGEVRPVGGTAVRKVDVRIIAATNQDLEAMVRRGTFREDLYYRLNVLQIELPPLRDRGDDVITLARHFLTAAGAGAGRRLDLDASAQDALRRASWPGNVRQLQNEMQRAAVLAAADLVTADDLSPGL